MPTPNYSIKNIDHLGLVAAMCKDLKIAEMVDAVIPKQADCNITHGQALVAMILNGLGFHSSTLHMFSQYFKKKPTERLIGNGVLPEHLTDDVLGRCLDALYDTNVSALYQVIAEKVLDHLKIQPTAVHLDITSFHVDGDYDTGDNTECIQLVKGYSRDHRPELNQVVLEMICENQAGIPVYMQALSGNTNDQKAFLRLTREHIQSLKAAQQSRYLIGDAALYTEETISTLHQRSSLFLTRVPQTLKEAKTHIEQTALCDMTPLGNGYHGRWVKSQYAGVPQQWLVVKSEQAAKRQQVTLEKNIIKYTDKEQKLLNKLMKKGFACELDAQNALAEFQEKLDWCVLIKTSLIKKAKFQHAGRPKKCEQPESFQYFIIAKTQINKAHIAKKKEQSGMFILSTNASADEFTMNEMLSTYKSQQTIERGFRFLKSPEFLTSSLFLKKPERIEALLMVMTCSLMIYAALEHTIRKSLKESERSVPDMKKKPTQRPTVRWIFICFEGIHELHVGSEHPVVVGLTDMQRSLLEILGKPYLEVYS